VSRMMDTSFSLGMRINTEGSENGVLVDVIPGTPAAEAGLAPGMKISSVNGSTFSAPVLTDAIRGSQGGRKAITLVVQNSGFTRTYEVQYHGGERYPHLERDTSQPDLLSDTLRPLTAAPDSK